MKHRLTVCIFILLAAGTGRAAEIVIFDSVSFGYRPAVDAGAAISADVHAYTAGEGNLWINDVGDGADIVVYDCGSTSTRSPGGDRHAMLNAIVDYLNTNPDGVAVVALWFMEDLPGHDLWTIMDVTYCDYSVDPLPIHHWAAHEIWTGIPDPLRRQESGLTKEAMKVSATGGGNAIGGYTSGPSACEAGLVVGDDDRTVFIGLYGTGAPYDDDFDGVSDWEELYRNVFCFLLYGVPVEEETWTAIKALFR